MVCPLNAEPIRTSVFSYNPRTRRSPRSTSSMRDAGRCPAWESRSVLSSVTKAVTLTTESRGSPDAAAGRIRCPASRPGRVGGDHGSHGGAKAAGVERMDWITRTGRRWRACCRAPRRDRPSRRFLARSPLVLGGQPSPADRNRVGSGFVLTGDLERLVDLLCQQWAPSSSRYSCAARAKNSERLMPSSLACLVAC